MIMLAILAAAVQMSAQKGMNINEIFDGRYRDNDAAHEIYMSGGKLSSYGLDLYHSLTLTGMPDEASAIERLVMLDGRRAKDKEVIYRDGGLYYGFYVFDGSYIFYLNQHRQNGDKIIVIYLQGDATPERIKSMLKQ